METVENGVFGEVIHLMQKEAQTLCQKRRLLPVELCEYAKIEVTINVNLSRFLYSKLYSNNCFLKFSSL